MKKAEMAFREALQRQADYLPALLALARLFRQAGSTEQTLAILEKARSERPDQAEIASELAITYDGLGEYEKAEPLHRQAAAQEPALAAAFNNLGFHFLLRENYAEAAPALERAWRLEPDNPVTRNNLAVVYVLNGQSDQALSLFEKTLGPAAAWNNLGYILMTQGKKEQAEKAFRRALELNPRFYAAAKDNLEKLQRREKPICRIIFPPGRHYEKTHFPACLFSPSAPLPSPSISARRRRRPDTEKSIWVSADSITRRNSTKSSSNRPGPTCSWVSASAKKRPRLELYLRGGAAVPGDEKDFQDNFDEENEPFAGVGIKGAFQEGKYFSWGMCLQGAYLGDSVNGGMEIRNQWEVELGFPFQGQLGPIILYAGPVFYHAQFKTDNAADDSPLREDRNVGGFGGVGLDLGPFRLEAEAQYRSDLSLGGFLSVHF